MTFSNIANQNAYPFNLPKLPYSKDALAPHMSAETFDYHHGKHHNTYVVNLNKLVENNQALHNKTLEDLILESSKDLSLGGVFNNAAQVWNHTFFWHSMKVNGGGKPSPKLFEMIENDFGSFEKFTEDFKTAGASQFGSGWVWLVNDNGTLKITKTSNAETPITDRIKPLICCDVWEHAYYVDYRNARPKFLEVFLSNLVNWDFAESNL